MSLSEIYPDDAALERTVRETYGPRLSAEKLAPAVRFQSRVVQHPTLPEFLAKLLHPQHVTSQSLSVDAVFVQQGMVLAKLQGFKRLQPAGQAEVVGTMADMLKSVRPADCHRLMLGDISMEAATRLELDHVLGLSTPRFERLIRLHEDAVLAELSQGLPARVITPEQARSRQQALETAVAALRRSRFPAADIQRFEADPSAVPATLACGIGVADLEAMLALPEPHRTWSIASFIGGM